MPCLALRRERGSGSAFMGFRRRDHWCGPHRSEVKVNRFAHLAEKSERGSISNLSTKVQPRLPARASAGRGAVPLLRRGPDRCERGAGYLADERLRGRARRGRRGFPLAGRGHRKVSLLASSRCSFGSSYQRCDRFENFRLERMPELKSSPERTAQAAFNRFRCRTLSSKMLLSRLLECMARVGGSHALRGAVAR